MAGAICPGEAGSKISCMFSKSGTCQQQYPLITPDGECLSYYPMDGDMETPMPVSYMIRHRGIYKEPDETPGTIDDISEDLGGPTI